jgi:FkbM family methyltransferase
MIKINGKWDINLPEDTAKEWIANMAHHPEGWEMKRLEKLKSLIKKGTTVLYIGAYKGDMPALLGTWGAEVINVEASPGFWGLIKETFEMNGLKPLANFNGLISTRTTTELSKKELQKYPKDIKEYIEGTTGFIHLSDGAGYFPEITVDELCERLEVIPDIITIDIEGSELEALKGATDMIKNHSPKFLISVHPEFMFHSHNTYERELHDLLRNNGYVGEWIDYDHEHHWLYERKS